MILPAQHNHYRLGAIGNDSNSDIDLAIADMGDYRNGIEIKVKSIVEL